MTDASQPIETDPAASWAEVRDFAAAADELFFAMRRSRAMTAGQFGHDLSTAQITLLEPLVEDDGVPVGRLAAAAAVSVPTATRMLKQLETRRLVDRQRSTADDRVVLIRLTDEGRELLTDLRDRLHGRQAATLSRFSRDEREHLSSQLRRLAELVSEIDD
jgi:MarR family transcriptional regulator, organic hydroperoxide resistance regulator